MKTVLIILSFVLFASSVHASESFQKRDSVEVLYGTVRIDDVIVRGRSRQRGIYRDPSRLERIVAKVYPIAKEANLTLREMEREMMKLPSEKKRKEYVESVEKIIKKKYLPVLTRMTTSEGLVLLKLIDRETGDTSYELVKELRGGFSAFFWQNVARLFSVNLKSKYDATGEDRMIEYYVQKYENGLK